MAKYQILVKQNDCRLDKYITEEIGDISRSRVQSLIKSGYVKSMISKQIISPSHMTKIGEEYNVMIPENLTSPDFSTSKALDIVCEDEHMAVINKPAGLTVHGGIGTKGDTLVDILLKCYGQHNLSDSKERPGIVHRLDKDTSGLMLIAKNNYIHAKLADAISNREITRKYIAIVSGILKEKSGTVETKISKNPKNKRKMRVVQSSGKVAITHYKLLSVISNKYSIIECSLETGRTHQIRVHMKYLCHPIIGDTLYGPSSTIITRQALHAYKLEFQHPVNNKFLSYETNIPSDIKKILHI